MYTYTLLLSKQNATKMEDENLSEIKNLLIQIKNVQKSAFDDINDNFTVLNKRVSLLEDKVDLLEDKVDSLATSTGTDFNKIKSAIKDGFDDVHKTLKKIDGAIGYEGMSDNEDLLLGVTKTGEA